MRNACFWLPVGLDLWYTVWMSLNWWQSTGAKPAIAVRTGKYGARQGATELAKGSKREKEDEQENIYGWKPILTTALVLAFVIAWYQQRTDSLELFDDMTIVLLTLVLAFASTVALVLRYVAKMEVKRAYLPIAFGSTLLLILGLIVILPVTRGVPETLQEMVALRTWSAFMVRAVLATLVVVAIVVEQSPRKQLNANMTWFCGISGLLSLFALIALIVMREPMHIAIGPIGRWEELMPLTIFGSGLGFLLARNTWRQDRFTYHLVFMLLILTFASIAAMLAHSRLFALENVSSIFSLSALAMPFFSVQTGMYASYLTAERYRQRENWMTRSVSGTRGGQELSPVVFREIAQQLNEALAITDVSGRIIFANSFLARLAGRKEEQLLAATPALWQHGSVAPDFYPRIFARILKDKVMYEGEVKNAYPANPEKGYTAALRITPVLNEVGDISCCVLQQRNVSAEQERAHLLRQMIDTMPLGVMLMDVPSMTITLINTEAEYLLSRTGFNIRAVRRFDDIVTELKTVEGKPYARQKLPPLSTIESKKPSEAADIAIFLENATSPSAIWKMQATPFFHEDGTMHSMLVSFQDVARHREYEHKMSDFISVASHQLRTPLTSIKWTLDMLRKKDTKMNEEEKVLMFDTCYQASERMMMTIQQLLQVAEIEETNITGIVKDSAQLAVTTVIEQSLQALKPLVEQKKLKVKQSVLRTLPPVRWNALALSQVMHNLMENAVKYTPEGGDIDSILTVKNNMIEWTLHDTGIGISAQQMPKLFQKFMRGDNAQRIHPDGTGLGLYIAKSTLEAAGGSIRIESEEGKGTTIYVLLPLEQAVRREDH